MREMKNSGVEWVGEIPVDWDVLRNKNTFICRKKLVGVESSTIQLLSLTTKGVRKKDVNNSEGKLPESFDTYQYVQVDELVMCLFDLDCSAVFSGISPYSGMISPAYKVLSCLKNMVPRYADYWFRYISDGRKFNHYAKNIRYTISYEEFSSLPILVPTIDIQKKIVSFLDSKCSKIDAIIAREQAVIKKLKEYKLSVITEAVTKGLNADVPMKDSNYEFIGIIPEHWKVAKLGSIFSFLGGYAYSSDVYVSESLNQVLRMGNIKNDHLVLEASPVYISEDTAQQTDRFKLSPGNILFTMTGTKGKRDYFFTHLLKDDDFTDFCLYLNQRVGCLIPSDNVWAGYYNYLLKDSRILDSVFLYETGTANQGNLGIDNIRRTKLQVPPYKEQCDIYEYIHQRCEKVDSFIFRKQSLITKLTEYKKSLIYEVVTGKKEV